MALRRFSSRRSTTEPLVRRAGRIALVASLVALSLAVLPKPVVKWIDDFRVDREVLSFDTAVANGPAGRAVSEAVDVDNFVSFGVSFTEPPADDVLVRWSGADGWSSWEPLDVSDDEGPDLGSAEATAAAEKSETGGGAVVSQPMWVGDATSYQVSLSAADATAQNNGDGANAMLVRENGRTMSVEAQQIDAGASTSGPTVHSRSEWSARAPKDSFGSATLKLAVVHHSASGNDYSRADVPSIIRSIQTYHMDSNGWSDIGYNFIVDKYGEIWEGRDGSATRNTPGAHASGFNTGSVGVVALGEYSSASPSGAQITSISEIIAKRFAENLIDPSTAVQFTSGGGPKYPVGTVVTLNRVIAHTDVGATECPGSRLYPSVSGSIRTKVQQVVATYTSPVGKFDAVGIGPGSLTVSGWALDPETSDGIQVHVYVDGRGYNLGPATLQNPDMVAAFGVAGSYHGFSRVIGDMEPGSKSVCAFAINVGAGSNLLLGCQRVTVPGGPPIGRIDKTVAAPNGLVGTEGWTIDPDTSTSNSVHVYVDGRGYNLGQARVERNDVAQHFAGYGPNHGYSFVRGGFKPGRHEVCVFGIDISGDRNSLLGCRQVTVPGGSPIGSIDEAAKVGSSIRVQGWVLDPDVTDAISTHVYIDGRGYNLGRVSGSRPDVGNAFFGYGSNHGVNWQSPPLAAGNHTVCVYGINVGVGSNSLIGCRTVRV